MNKVVDNRQILTSFQFFDEDSLRGRLRFGVHYVEYNGCFVAYHSGRMHTLSKGDYVVLNQDSRIVDVLNKFDFAKKYSSI